MLLLRSPPFQYVVVATAVLSGLVSMKSVTVGASPTQVRNTRSVREVSSTTESSSSGTTESSSSVSLPSNALSRQTVPQRQERRRAEGNSNDEDDQDQDEEYFDPMFERGYLQATQCASYTIALDDQDYDYGSDLGIAVVGQETFLFFEYTVTYDNYAQDDDQAEQEQDEEEEGASEDNENRRRKLQDGGSSQSQYFQYNNGNVYQENNHNNKYYYYNDDSYTTTYNYPSNAMLAKDWLVAHSDGALQSGCLAMQGGASVFSEYVPAVADGSLTMPALYSGPVCSTGASAKENSTVLELGVFLDASCRAYVPGLSRVLNEIVLTNWTMGGFFRGSNSNYQNDQGQGNNGNEEANKNHYYSRYYNANGDDLESSLDSYQTLLNQLNYYHNWNTINCETVPGTCQRVFEAAVDLDTCHSLAYELWEVAYNNNGDDNDNNNGDGASNEGDRDDQAGNYGEFFRTAVDGSGSSDPSNAAEAYEYHYRMYEQALDDHSTCSATYASSYSGNDDGSGCSGWHYGWGNYDCNVGNNNNDDDDDDGVATNPYDNNNNNGGDGDDNDCHRGICYGVLESEANGYPLPSWLAAKSDELEHEWQFVYGMKEASRWFWYGIAFVGASLLAILLALACWTEGLLRSWSVRSKRRLAARGKTEAFLPKRRTWNDDCGDTTSSSESSRESLAIGELLPDVQLELAPTSSTLSSGLPVPPPPPLLERDRTSESIEMILGSYAEEEPPSLARPPRLERDATGDSIEMILWQLQQQRRPDATPAASPVPRTRSRDPPGRSGRRSQGVEVIARTVGRGTASTGLASLDRGAMA